MKKYVIRLFDEKIHELRLNLNYCIQRRKTCVEKYLRVFGKESPNTWAFMQGMNLPFFEKEMSNSLLAIK